MARHSTTIRTLTQLQNADFISANPDPLLDEITSRYAVAITPAIAALIDPDNPNDPIARQFVPDHRELNTHRAELHDPISDHPFTAVPGIVHRYRNRALLKITNICPVYCRFCFRREMIGPGHGGGLTDKEIADAITYITDHPELEEIIMTGGDPLILSPRRIKDITTRLSEIPHLRTIRWHTRVPVVAPDRVNSELLSALISTACKVRVAVHTNHPCELTLAAAHACNQLCSVGIELLSQTVLLRGINDCAQTLKQLMQAIAASGITPYYLHHGDLAPGTMHFRTTIAEGQTIMAKLAKLLPANLQPTYVLDLPGGHGKVPITPTNFQLMPDGAYKVAAPNGHTICYRDITEEPAEFSCGQPQGESDIAP